MMIENMCQNVEANYFFKAFFQYCTLLQEFQSQKKTHVLKVNRDQQKYIEASKMPGVKVLKKNNSEMEVECSKKDKKKLEK